MKVELLPQAAADLDAIYEPLYGRVLKRLRTLRDFPEVGAPMAGEFADYRASVVELYRVVYRIRPDQVVEVAYIRDCRRRPSEED